MADYKEFIKKERMPAIWCAGCGIHVELVALAKAMADEGWTDKDAVLVSGIGCTGRIAGYFNLDSVHTTHGRALPVAEAIKLVNQKLNVIVASGDGDLTSIGGNHLIHSARRNMPITVLMNNNETYGMTGGQASPMTKQGRISLTTPQGSESATFNVQYLMAAARSFFYARTAAIFPEHLQKVIKSALAWPGFRLIEVQSYCPERFGKMNKIKTLTDYINQVKEQYHIREESSEKFLNDNELGIVCQKEI